MPLTICSHMDAKGLQEREPQRVLATITGARKGVLFDATLDDRFASVLLHTIEGQEQVRMRLGSVRALRTNAFERVRGTGVLPPRHLSAEQSNSSVAYGDRLILKLFRRFDTGVNPDFEIGSYLTDKTDFTRVPAMAAALEYTPIAEPTATLGMMQALVESQGDGWAHATDDVRRFYDAVQGRPVPPTQMPAASDFESLVRADVPTPVRDVLSGYLAVAGTLGRRTAGLHLALASNAADPAFAPEPFTAADLAHITVSATAEAQHAFDALRALQRQAKERSLSEDLLARIDQLLQREPAVLARLHAAPPLEYSTTKIRIHGDYHLGQVLWSEGDFYILDFEGEPSKPIMERRRKQSPLKDVAGMLRSFSYAAHAGLFAFTAGRPDVMAHFAQWADVWERWTTATFLREYFGAVSSALFVPANPNQRDELLALFVLEKALYELNYEINNRPDWLRIPLSGILRLFD
jgi:maltose alpha-D-glucosyltransferase/alpha-amylase